MAYKKLFEVANRAKTIGRGEDYRLPNAIFAFLLMEYFRGAEGLRLLLETQDQTGESWNESYYDILVVVSDEGDSLNIPLPLLHQVSLAGAMKTALLLDRGEHRRDHIDGSPGELFGLARQLVELIPTRHLRYVAEQILA